MPKLETHYAAVNGESDSPTSFVFITTDAYSGGGIALATGISVATDDQASSYPTTPVKSLLRMGYLRRVYVELEKDGDEETHVVSILHTSDKSSSFEDEIVDTTWTYGKYSGYKVVGVHYRTRVTSKR